MAKEPQQDDLTDDASETLQNEYDGDAERDGIPANGTRPVTPQGPDDLPSSTGTTTN